jgi:uncharacterized protein YqeY
MSLKQRINEDMKAAMRAKDQARLESIRMLMAAIQRREVDERITLDDPQVMAVIEKMIKQSRDAVDQFTKGGRQDLVDKENRDIAILKAYLPEALSEAEIDKLIAAAITEAGATSIKDMGKVVSSLKPKLQGRADMGKVSAKVKQRLAGAS